MQALDFTGELTPVHVAEMEKFNKYDPSKVEEHFDEVSCNYEQIYLRAGYPDPKKVQEAVSEIQKTTFTPRH